MSGPTIKQLVESCPAHYVANMHSVITVWSDATAREALELFQNHKIHSAPVVDRKSGKYVGLLDLLDLVKFLTDGFNFQSFAWIDAQRDDRSKMSIEKIYTHHEDVTSLFVDIDASLSTVLHKLQLQPRFHHRALIVRQTVVPRGYVTEANVVRWLAGNINAYGHLFAQSTLKELGLVHEMTPTTVSENASAGQAFNALVASNQNSIPILNAAGAIVANLSVSDILGITEATFDRLRKPVLEYITEFTTSKVPTLTSRASDTFELTLLRLSVSGLHQFWVVDDKKHPIGYVSASEVVQLLERV